MTIQWGTNTVHTFDKGSTSTGAAAPPATAAPAPAAAGGAFAFGGAPAAAPPPAFPTFGSTGAPGTSAPAPPAAGAPTTTLFGSAPAASTTAPAAGTMGGLFGSSTPSTAAPAFGAPSSTTPTSSLFGAPAPSGGGLFGSGAPLGAPAPAGGGGLFGGLSTTGSAPSSSAFGGTSFSFTSTSTPAPAPGAFGAPSSGLFGSLGGTPQPPQQQQQQQFSGSVLVPAQAALQAHQNAEARQEEARVMSALAAIHQAYAGTATCPDDNEWGDVTRSASSASSAPFTLIYYTDISPELRQQQWLQGMIVGGGGGGSGVDGTPAMVRPVVPPRPPQVSGRDWRTAAARNPDPASYMPAVLLGASALQSRIAYQQEAANIVTEQLQLVRDTLTSLREQSTNLQTQVADMVATRRAQQKSQLLSILRKVELVRSFQVPLQNGEVQALERLVKLHRDIERTVQPAVHRLRDGARQLRRPSGDANRRRDVGGGTARGSSSTMTPEQVTSLKESLQYELGPCIGRVQTALEKECRDAALIKKRVDAAPPPALPAPPVANLRR